MMIRTLAAVAACAVLAACGTTSSLDLKTFAADDLAAARADAAAHQDAAAVACYDALAARLQAVAPSVPPIGAVSSFQKARNVRRALDAGVPEAVHVACAPLVVDAETTFLRLGLIAAPLPLPVR